MLFNSLPFLFGFLPVCLLFYFGLARFGWPRAANASLALASLIFYGAWAYERPDGSEARRLFGYVFLLCASTTLNYFLGVALQRKRHRRLLIAGVTANLLVLGWFKYVHFGLATLDGLLGAHWKLPAIILPLAISFYTFTQIAFLVDAYRGLVKEMNFARYCLFVFFFPHLIAGPIVHHSEIMPQFAKPGAKQWHHETAALALSWLSLGLFKKVFIADSLAPLANAVFGHAAEVTIVEAWSGVLAYAFQLYFDFSGYSDMAIGLSLLFNVRLPDNFNSPYRAGDIIDFWRRWHITLSRFLRDYVYIPLGGNRHGSRRRYLYLFITMLIGGIWHGAGWQFILWGAYHGALLVVCHQWKKMKRHSLPLSLARAVTFLAVLLGWVLFRSADLGQARELYMALVDFSSFSMSHLVSGLQIWHLLWLAALLFLVNIAPNTREFLETVPLSGRLASVMAVLIVIALFLIRDVHLQFGKSEFIYFQF